MIARSIEQDTMYNSNDNGIVSIQWCVRRFRVNAFILVLCIVLMIKNVFLFSDNLTKLKLADHYLRGSIS